MPNVPIAGTGEPSKLSSFRNKEQMQFAAEEQAGSTARAVTEEVWWWWWWWVVVVQTHDLSSSSSLLLLLLLYIALNYQLTPSPTLTPSPLGACEAA